MTRRLLPTRTLPASPNLDQLRRQAKELLTAFRDGNAIAVKEVRTHYRHADPASFALHDAQLVLARAYGLDSWPKLKALVDGVTLRRLVDAIAAGDLAAVQAMVDSRPELVHLDVAEDDEHQALHHAVLHRHPDMVRFLMQRGADARKGIWPHRSATTAFTLAAERGYEEIAGIIESEERRRAGRAEIASVAPPLLAELRDAFRLGDEDAMIAVLDAHPPLAGVTDAAGWTALHWASARIWPKLATWLLARGADASARSKDGATPMEIIGRELSVDAPVAPDRALEAMTTLLQRHGAAQTAHAAIAAGDANWLRARAQEGLIADGAGLVSQAVAVNKPEMLALLLQTGLDPDEAGRVHGLEEVVPTWGEPLRACANSGNLTMAEMLLSHGANANTNVYAASTALSGAYQRRDQRMIELLEEHGARLNPGGVAELGLVDQAAQWLAAAADARPGTTAAAHQIDIEWELLWGSAGCPEIVTLVLAAVTWPPDDRRWHGILENGLYLGPESDRARHLDAFSLVLSRADPDVRDKRGTTLLHHVVASRGGLTADDRIAYATRLLDRGARLDLRDQLLASTPLGWACRWGRPEMVTLLLERGADPIESDAEAWARPMAWAQKSGRRDLALILEKATDPPKGPSGNN
jgi:ankyrin repeat protein